MEMVFYVSIIVLNSAGVLFACIYLVTNIFFELPDKVSRNKNMVRISGISVTVSLILALLAAFLSDPDIINKTISRTYSLFSIIGLSWLAIVALCGIAMIVIVVSKRLYKEQLPKTILRILIVALIGSVVGFFLRGFLHRTM